VILIDTNVWLYACLSDMPQHPPCRAWLEDVFNGEERIALPWQVAVSVLRISTQPKLLARPLTLEQALQLVQSWIEHPLVEVLTPGERHCPPGRPGPGAWLQPLFGRRRLPPLPRPAPHQPAGLTRQSPGTFATIGRDRPSR
jgi:hypothetical protein